MKIGGAPLIAGIRLYRSTLARIPRARVCLFSVTCSRHAEAAARLGGWRHGWRTARARLRACRPGYQFEFDSDGWGIRAVDGSYHDRAELSPAVHDEAAFLRDLIPGAGLTDRCE